MNRRRVFVLLMTGTVIVLCVASTAWLFNSSVVSKTDGKFHDVEIPFGLPLNAIMDQMSKHGTLTGSFRPKVVARLLGVENQIKAGRYEIKGGLSSYELLQLLVHGKTKVEWVTIPEGLPARDIAGIVSRRLEVDSTKFLSLVNDSSLVRSLGIETNSLEGFLFPETYGWHWGMSEEQILRTMVAEFNRQVTDSLRRAVSRSGYSFIELLTLASIIEGEAMVDSERVIISGVYHNRLKRGMLLQADPTIQYIVAGRPRRLLNRDLEIDSPYNTYKYAGLPPGPINNPGLASIVASIFPADVQYLYFVAAGDGSHTFSRTLSEHLKAKARFNRIRKRTKGRRSREKNG